MLEDASVGLLGFFGEVVEGDGQPLMLLCEEYTGMISGRTGMIVFRFVEVGEWCTLGIG